MADVVNNVKESRDDAWDNFKRAAKSAYLDGSGEKEQNDKGASIIFSLAGQGRTLVDALELFQNRKLHIKRIESRQSKIEKNNYDVYVNINEVDSSPSDITAVLEDLKALATNVIFHKEEETLWFPRKVSELDRFADRVLSNGAELDEDHPGFPDNVYRARRKEIAEIAITYKYGEPLPIIEYTEEEIETWNTVYTAVTKLHPIHACKEFIEIFPFCNFKLGTIPQFTDVSQFLKERTGFTLRPVAGLLSARDFLAGLAFRVFHATQYIRHGETPMYTPEPDVIRELIGHVPLFADREFAQFAQEIGLISLGASEEWIQRISHIYWFVVEFGLLRENGEIKAYGASLLSSFGELQYCTSDKPVHHTFDPEKTSKTSYPITDYQPQYFVIDSFQDARKKIREWATVIPKPYPVRYNAYTERIETLNDKGRVINLIREMKYDLDRFADALENLHCSCL